MKFKKFWASLTGIPLVILIATSAISGAANTAKKEAFFPYLAGFENLFGSGSHEFDLARPQDPKDLISSAPRLRQFFIEETRLAPSLERPKNVSAIESKTFSAGTASILKDVQAPSGSFTVSSQVSQGSEAVSQGSEDLPVRVDLSLGEIQLPVFFSPIFEPSSSSLTGSLLLTASNDPYYSSAWALAALNADSAWNFSKGQGIIVAVIDSGIQYTHEDLFSNIWTNPGEIAGNGIDDDYDGYIDDVYGWSFRSNNGDVADVDGHGTHVSGIIAGTSDNAKGAAGIAPEAKIMSLRVFNPFDSDLYAIVESIISSVRYAVDHGARVINISLGLRLSNFVADQFTRFQQAVSYARTNNVIVVAAAGNDNVDMNLYPALFSDAISVGALYRSNFNGSIQRDWYSSYGSALDFMAPGTDILSTRYSGSDQSSYPYFNGDTKYAQISGTSMASPMVAGAAALLLAEDPLLTFDDIYRRLKFSATDKGTAGFDNFNGWGMINPFKALSEDYYTNGAIKTRFLPTANVYEVIRTEYDLSGNVTAQLDLNGNHAVFTYFPSTTTVKTVAFYTPSDTLLRTNEYYPDGVTLYRRIYPSGHTYEYDLQGKLVKEILAGGPVFQYYSSGNAKSYSNGQLGIVVNFTDAAVREASSMQRFNVPGNYLESEDFFAYNPNITTSIDANVTTPSTIERRVVYNASGFRIREILFNSDLTTDKVLYYNSANPGLPFSVEVYGPNGQVSNRTINWGGGTIFQTESSAVSGENPISAILLTQPAAKPQETAPVISKELESKLEMMAQIADEKASVSRTGFSGYEDRSEKFLQN